MKWFEILVFLYLCSLLGAASAAQCGRQVGGRLCPGGLCCGVRGLCGSTLIYCGPGCQSQCWRGGDLSSLISESLLNESDLSSLISESLFNEMLKHSGDDRCHESFYTYNAFITAAKSFSAFGTTGDTDTRKREIAAFLAQTSHETNGGWLTATDEPYTWGYCWAKQLGNPGNYCVPSAQYPCAPGKKYYGRGPIQLKNNYNYGQAGQALGVDLLRNPDLVATDPVISFKTAIWFWMTPQSPKPSCHDVITGQWMPSGADLSAGRRPGYGVITNIIIGGLECGKGPNPQVQDRIGFYKRYCDMLGVSYGDNLDCDDQRPFGNLLLPEEI